MKAKRRRQGRDPHRTRSLRPALSVKLTLRFPGVFPLSAIWFHDGYRTDNCHICIYVGMSDLRTLPHVGEFTPWFTQPSRLQTPSSAGPSRESNLFRYLGFSHAGSLCKWAVKGSAAGAWDWGFFLYKKRLFSIQDIIIYHHIS